MKERTSADITIYRAGQGGTEVATVPISEGSERVFSLMKEDYIELKFSLLEAVYFEIGDYVDDEIFGRFVVTSHQMPSYNSSTGGFDYTLRLNAEYMKWGNWTFKLTTVANGTRVRKESDWSLTDVLSVHAQEILNNLSVIGDDCSGTAYTVSIESTAEHAGEVRYIKYSGISIIGAMDAMANEYGCEWWVDGSVIHFGKCEDSGDGRMEIELGVNAESMEAQSNVSEFANKIFAFGSTRNIPQSYRQKLEFTVTSLSDGYFEDSARPLTPNMISGGIEEQIGFHCSYMRPIYGTKTYEIFFKVTSQDGVYTMTTYDGSDSYVDPTEAYYYAQTSGTYSFTGSFKVNGIPDGTVAITVYMADSTFANVATIYSGTRTLTGSTGEVAISFEDVNVTLSAGAHHIVCKLVVTPADSTQTPSAMKSVIYVESGDDVTSCITVVDMQMAKWCRLTFNGSEYWVALHTGTSSYQLYFVQTAGLTGKISPPSGFAVGKKYTLEFWNGGNQVADNGLIVSKIPFSYYTEDYDSTSLAKIGEKRLMLPEATGGYLVADPDLERDQIVEQVVIFDDIFPRYVLKVSGVDTSEETETEEKADGSSYKWDWTRYTMNATDLAGAAFAFNKSFIKDGVTLQVKFLTEMEEQQACADQGITFVPHTGYRLAGMTFDVTFNNASRTYTLVRNETYGAKLPNETLFPAVGDPFVLIGWDVRTMGTLGLIAKAEAELQARAQEYLNAIEQDQFTFTCRIMSDDALKMTSYPLYDSEDYWLLDSEDYHLYVIGDENMYDLLIEGAKVRIIHGALSTAKDSRVIGYRFKLDKPYDTPQYTIGETDAYSRLKKLEKEITKLGGR